VIVAVATVGMVQVPAHQIVGVVAVGNHLMAASWAMLVACVVAVARMLRRAYRWVGRAHLQNVLVDMVAVGRMQMAFVQVVDMVAVADGYMAAAGAVNVRVSFVNSMIVRHEGCSLE
jgi:hypothetical protein